MSALRSYHPANTTSSENAAILKNPDVVYQWYYFDITHLGAIGRDVLAYGNLKWKNNAVPFKDDWKNSTKTPFKVLPFVEVQLESDPSKSVVVSESLNVDPFLAGKAGLLGDNEWEEQVIRSIYTNTICLKEAFYQNVTGQPTFDKKVEAGKEFAQTNLIRWIEAIEFHLTENARQNPGGYLVGKKISLADIALDNVVAILAEYPEAMAKPTLEALSKSAPICKVIQLVDNEPRLQEWRQSDEYSTLVHNTWVRNAARHTDPTKKDEVIVKASTPADNRATLVRYGVLRRAA